MFFIDYQTLNSLIFNNNTVDCCSEKKKSKDINTVKVSITINDISFFERR